MNCLYITSFFNTVAGIVQTFIKSLNQLLYSPSHRSLPPAIWTTSWLLFAPHQRRRTFSHRDVSLGEETSGNRWARGPDCTADGPIYPTRIFPGAQWWRARNGHLTGFWIGAAISNTSHSNKARSTTVKRARLTGKGSRSKAVLP